MPFWNVFDTVIFFKYSFFGVGSAFLTIRVEGARLEAIWSYVGSYRLILHTWNKLCWYFYPATSFGKLQCIALQIHKHLLNSHRISLDHIVERLSIRSFRKSNQRCQQLNILWISFILLNTIDFFDRFLDIKHFDYFIKFVSFDLSVPKNVFYIHKQKIAAWFLNTDGATDFALNFVKLILQWRLPKIFYMLDKKPERMKERFHDGALVNDAVKWVTHFVRYGGVDERQEFSFCFRSVV